MSQVIEQIKADLRSIADPIRAKHSASYFKSDPAETDEFLGVKVPLQRQITRKYFKVISPEEVVILLKSPVHEDRLTALMIWVLQFKSGDEKTKDLIYELYLSNTKYINNWDLVDTSARDIVGGYLFDKDRQKLLDLSRSKNIWDRRIAIIASAYFIARNDFELTLKLSKNYLTDDHHYIHKATGWMLREVGKKDQAVLLKFLDEYAGEMPRTALRYSLEKLSPELRAKYMAR